MKNFFLLTLFAYSFQLIDSTSPIWVQSMLTSHFKSKSSVSKLDSPPNNHIEQTIRALKEVGLDWVGEVKVTEMSAGFCNAVYQVELDVPACIQPKEGPREAMGGWLKFANSKKRLPGRDETIKRKFVVKIFSQLAKLRQTKQQIGVMDAQVATIGLAPRLVACSADMVIHEYFKGRELSEDDLVMRECASKEGSLQTQFSPFVLGERIASKLAKLHTTKWPKEFDSSEPILWLSIDRMIKQIEKKPHLLPTSFSVDSLRAEVSRVRRLVESLPLGIVLGHGDFKPTNLMATSDMSSIVFIDFELSGPNYRGFDIFKLYRRGQIPANNKDTCSHLPHATDKLELKRFAAAYIRALGDCDPSASVNFEQLMSEVLLFEPLTWLEASIFFLFAMTEDETNVEKWTALAVHRWENYEKTKHKLENYAKELRDGLSE